MRSSSAWVLQLVLFSMIARRWAEEYPEPRIVAVGATGVGKSSLVNALLGCDPRGSECLFGVCGGTDSCTNQTAIGSGPWLGDGADFTAVDTPGFGDSSGSDNKLIEEMMDVLDGKLGYANAILLVLEGSTPRFSSGLYDMLRVMTSIFGDSWWQFMLIGVSKWPYDQASIDKRQEDCDYYGDPSENCKNEAWFRREFNRQLQDKFGITKNFTFAFMDSYSQSGPELGDEVQQQHWQDETQLLWDHATLNDDTFEFLTIDEVLEENQLCKEENQRLHNIIDENITLLFNYVQANTDQISTTQEELSLIDIKVDSTQAQVDINIINIDVLEVAGESTRTDLQSVSAQVDINMNDIDALEVAGVSTRTEVDINTKAIGTLETDKVDLNTKAIGTLETDKVDLNTKAIGTLETDKADKTVVDKIKGAPLGTILAWVSKPESGSEEFADFPDGWQRCDGSVIPHGSIWEGKKTPDLNNEGRFLRGAIDKDMLTLENDQLQDHTHYYSDPGHDHDYTDPGHGHIYQDHYFSSNHPGTGPNARSDTIEDSYAYLHSKTSTDTTIGITIDKKKIGITVTGVHSGHHGPETRPVNMKVIYIIRIY